MPRAINFRAEDGLGAFPNETPYQLRFNYSVASLFAIAPIVPMPPVTVPTLLFLDVSKWNGQVNFSKSVESGARAVWIKSDQGAWTDARFHDHVDAAEGVIDYGFYHFADPSQTTITPESAAAHCASLTKDVGNLSTWLDVERTGPLGPQGMLDYIIRWVNAYQDLTGKMVEIYTRMSFFNPNVARSNFFRSNKIRLNAARYHLGLSTPWSDGHYKPLDWDLEIDQFQEWQYSADGNGLGAYFGAESNSIDLNLFAGTEADFVSVYNLETDPPVDPIPPDIIKRIEDLEKKTSDIETQIVELNEKHETDVAEINKRLDDLESNPPTPPIDPGDDETVTVIIDEQHKAHYYRSTDDKGKPIMETRDDLDPFIVNSRWECQRRLALHSLDNPDTPTTIASGGSLFYRIVDGSEYHGRFIRDDKSKEVYP